jgi:hypothetical protein
LPLLPFLALILIGLLVAPPAHGWWVEGHARIAEAAARILPDDVPAFFRAAGRDLGHMAGDPDRWKNKDLPHLRSTESPEHFLDLEYLDGAELPVDRYKLIDLLKQNKRQPSVVGMLPFALLEAHDRLACAFQDYRSKPEDAIICAKCLVHAGILSHYTGDCSMPLHTTKDYDGRPDDKGGFTQKGIHARLDAFPEKHGLTAEELARELKVEAITSTRDRVMEEIRHGHGLVDKCYSMDANGAFVTPTTESRAFVLDRCRRGVKFTAELWYSAWQKSATLPKPY